jgi:hypothetical protein
VLLRSFSSLERSSTEEETEHRVTTVRRAGAHKARLLLGLLAVSVKFRIQCTVSGYCVILGGCMSLVTDVNTRPLQLPRRQVAIRRDGRDVVIALQPEDLIVFRNESAGALRRACSFLWWEVVSDTV